jgi:Flp pilus assembly protein TadG
MPRTQQGQAMVEFALIAIVLLALVFAVIDLARAGFMQHDLDAGASDLVGHLAALSGTNSSGNANTPNGGTRLDPTNSDTTCFSTDPSLDPTLCQTMPVSQAMQMALAHAAQIASYNFSASPPLTTTGPMTLTNGQVTVVGTPYLTSTITSTTELTVTITAPFTPVVGFYLHNAVLHLQARASVLAPAGPLAP